MVYLEIWNLCKTKFLEIILDNISERENGIFFKMKGGIPSVLDWNEILNIARNLRQISGMIIMESNEEEVTGGNKGADLLSRI